MKPGERRIATEDERALFYETFADVKPLKPHTKPVRAKKKPPSPLPAKAAKAKPKAKPKPPLPVVRDAPPEIGGHRTTPLKRGRLEPEARLDLHGLTQDAAHRALIRFLQRGRANGARVVLVITGKSGVLNRQLKPWLAQGELRALVSGVSTAHKRHGGAGAYYVLLKKPAEARR
jgi:DNA-nicking Smr family endonuclease